MDRRELSAATSSAASVLQWFAFAYAGAIAKALPQTARTAPCSAFKAWSDRVDADVTRDIATMPDLGPRTKVALLKFKDDALAAVASYVPSCTGSQGTIDLVKLRNFLTLLGTCQRTVPAPVIVLPKPPVPTPTAMRGMLPKPPVPTPTMRVTTKPTPPMPTPMPTPTIMRATPMPTPAKR
jgi:hypothetical protein